MVFIRPRALDFLALELCSVFKGMEAFEKCFCWSQNVSFYVVAEGGEPGKCNRTCKETLHCFVFFFLTEYKWEQCHKGFSKAHLC